MTSRRDCRDLCASRADWVATFELIPRMCDEWRRRFDAVAERELPFVTATLGREEAGYGYCAPWKTRPAYRHTVDT